VIRITKILQTYHLLIALLLIVSLSKSASAENSLELSAKNSIQQAILRKPDASESWFAYQIEMEPNNGMPCCYLGNKQQGCSLERRKNHWGSNHRSNEIDSSILRIYFQTKDKMVNDIFIAGSECHVEQGSKNLNLLEQASQTESLEFLNSLILNKSNDKQVKGIRRNVSDQALAGIALHKGKPAYDLLNKMTDSQDRHLSHKAVFWLGQARNEAGYRSLINIIDDKQQPIKKRKQSVFALSVNRHYESGNKLLELAKASTEDLIRGEALFWIAEKNIPGAIKVIVATLNESSSRKLQDKAVFALSQIDTDQAWAVLKDIAKEHRSIVVQKQAVFWLSQNHSRKPLGLLLDIAQGRAPKSVREQAVFSISQLDSTDSVDGLVKLLKSSKERFIKQKAIFWLGQSDEEAAAEFVESLILTSNNQ